MYSVVSTD
ncbi:hypothetical protein LINPERPRIM_LOCUS22057 [Linum perenne]